MTDTLSGIKKCLLLTLTAGFFTLLPAAELICNGESKAAVLLAAEAPAPIVFAAEEISAYAKKITGTPLPIITKTFGKEKFLIRFKLKNDPALGDEGYRITMKNNSLIISGKKSFHRKYHRII